MKKIIYSIFALTFLLASCNNSEEAHDHNDGTHQHEDGDAHDHGTHEHEDGDSHEDHDHDHHQEEFNVGDTLKK